MAKSTSLSHFKNVLQFIEENLIKHSKNNLYFLNTRALDINDSFIDENI